MNNCNLEQISFVDDGSIQSFRSTISNPYKSDVLNTFLLAQLAANKKYSRLMDIENWNEEFNTVLGKLYWNNLVVKTAYYSPNTSFTIEDIIKDILNKNKVPQPNIFAIMNSIEIFKSLSEDDEAYKIYNDSTHNKNVINLHICIVTEKYINCLLINFKTEQKINSIFLDEYLESELSTSINTQYSKATLNAELYSIIRDSVIKKLGSKRDELIKNFCH